MRVAHLTSAHKVKDVRIYHKECMSLIGAGHRVHLVVPTTDYRDDEETEEEIRIHPVPVPSSRKDRFLKTPIQVHRIAQRFI